MVPKIRNIDPVEDAAKDTSTMADYHEAIFVYNEHAPIIHKRYAQNKLVDWAFPVPVTIRLTEEPGNNKTILENVRTELERIFGVQVTGFDEATWTGPRNMTLAGKGFYEARYILYLHQYGAAVSAGWTGTGATGGSLWAAPLVLYSASSLFSAERVLSLTGTDTMGDTLTMMAIAFAADSTYDIGTTTVRPKKIYSDDLDSTAATIGTLTLTNPLADASVADDITLTNITQITNRSHTSLTDKGTNTHAQIDTAVTNSVNHIADSSDPHSTVEDAAYGAGWNADTTHAPSQNAVYDTLSAHYADVDAHHEPRILPSPKIDYANGADGTSSGAPFVTLARFAAAETDDSAALQFQLPADATAGSYDIKALFVTPTAGDSATFNGYVSQAKDADAYAGWNILNNGALWTVTTTGGWVLEGVSYAVASCEAGDVITIKMVKTSSDTRDFHLTSIWMELT